MIVFAAGLRNISGNRKYHEDNEMPFNTGRIE